MNVPLFTEVVSATESAPTDNSIIAVVLAVFSALGSVGFIRFLDWWRNGRKLKREEERGIADDQSKYIISPMQLQLDEMKKEITNLKRVQRVSMQYIVQVQLWYYRNHPDSELVFPLPPDELQE